MKINDLVYHPCSIDILEFKVIGIQYWSEVTQSYIKQYVLKATKNVGACGKVEVLVVKYLDKYIFIGLIDEDLPYASGLQDFVEGNYYSDKDKARLEYYRQQELLAYNNMDNKLKVYQEAKARYEQIKSIIQKING